MHIVSRGQSLGRIARRYRVTVDAIRQRNGLRKGGKKIQPGQRVIIPASEHSGDNNDSKKDAAGGTQKAAEIDTKSTTNKRRRRRTARCPPDMVRIAGQFCIDRYEAYVVVIPKGGRARRHSPHKPIGKGKKIKAMNRRGRLPQAYISRNQAALACQNAGKRLCTDSEWVKACKGKKPTTWPYGDKHQPGRCNDRGVSYFNKLFGPEGEPAPQSAYTWENLNDPRLNKAKGTCAPSGRFGKCRNSYKVYDMVGNLHEWTAAPGGTFRGGFYLDVHKHGDGCDYKTTAHSSKYHDYSTGFRCCK